MGIIDQIGHREAKRVLGVAMDMTVSVKPRGWGAWRRVSASLRRAKSKRCD